MSANHAKPSLFIGSSSEGLDIARAIEYNLQHDVEVTIWDQGIFGLSHGPLESLVASLERFDFATLVITPDDVTISRGNVTQSPRDNVMFELGLFMGRLGRARTFIVCSDHKDMKLPSDLAGVTIATYSSSRSDGNFVAAVSPSCFMIRKSIKDLGIAEAKRLTKLQQATSQVEGISDKAIHLIGLMARSRILELEHIKNQFGYILPEDFLAKLMADLKDLEEATNK